jgi:hypothetical protein
MPMRELRVTPEDIYGAPLADGTFRPLGALAVQIAMQQRLHEHGFDLTQVVQRRREGDVVVFWQRQDAAPAPAMEGAIPDDEARQVREDTPRLLIQRRGQRAYQRLRVPQESPGDSVCSG